MGNMCLQKMFDKENNAHIKLVAIKAYYAVTWPGHLVDFQPFDISNGSGLGFRRSFTILSIDFQHEGVDVLL